MNASLAILLGVLLFFFIVAHKMDKDDERKQKRRERLYTNRQSNDGERKI